MFDFSLFGILVKLYVLQFFTLLTLCYKMRTGHLGRIIGVVGEIGQILLTFKCLILFFFFFCFQITYKS